MMIGVAVLGMALGLYLYLREKADPLSRANYYRAFRESAEKAQIGWAIWDWKAGFHYWNEQTNKAEPGMHEALFGKSSARTIR